LFYNQREGINAEISICFWFRFGDCDIKLFADIDTIFCALQFSVSGEVSGCGSARRIPQSGGLREGLVIAQWSNREWLREAGLTMAAMQLITEHEEQRPPQLTASSIFISTGSPSPS
jgi:hypothetical protein